MALGEGGMSKRVQYLEAKRGEQTRRKWLSVALSADK